MSVKFDKWPALIKSLIVGDLNDCQWASWVATPVLNLNWHIYSLTTLDKFIDKFQLY